MKIGTVAVENNGWQSGFSDVFARAPFLVIYDSDTDNLEIIDNPYIEESHGLGARVSQFFASKGVEVVVAPHVGPRAKETLDALGIKIVETHVKTVKEAIDSVR